MSPLTIDWVNPEAPWPALERLEAVTADAGFILRPRLPVYPEFLTEHWVAAPLLADAVSIATPDGYAAIFGTDAHGTDARAQGVR